MVSPSPNELRRLFSNDDYVDALFPDKTKLTESRN